MDYVKSNNSNYNEVDVINACRYMNGEKPLGMQSQKKHMSVGFQIVLIVSCIAVLLSVVS